MKVLENENAVLSILAVFTSSAKPEKKTRRGLFSVVNLFICLQDQVTLVVLGTLKSFVNGKKLTFCSTVTTGTVVIVGLTVCIQANAITNSVCINCT